MESRRPLIIAGLAAFFFVCTLMAIVAHVGRAASLAESAPIPVEENNTMKPPTLTPEQQAIIEGAGWTDRVGANMGVWISVAEQVFRVVQNGDTLWETPCSTAARGTGSKMNSLKTPLGWHSISDKIGEGAPYGQVFREKRPTSEIWHPGDAVKEDLVLTRLLVLSGEEPGVNKGGDVDSFRRCIYIHGTNDEPKIGTPASHGCIRLTNNDVVTAYDLIPVGTLVLITE